MCPGMKKFANPDLSIILHHSAAGTGRNHSAWGIEMVSVIQCGKKSVVVSYSDLQ
jgi:hypothetical protein